MKWCWVALAALVLAIGIGLWVGSIQNQKFIEKDAERVVQIEKYREDARRYKLAAEESLERVGELETRKKKLEETLAVTRARWRRRLPPESIEDCKEQIGKASDHIINLETMLIFERDSGQALADALFATQGQVDRLEKAWQLERKRTESYQKKQKKNKIKNVVIGVSSAAAGVGVGFMVGALYQ